MQPTPTSPARRPWTPLERDRLAQLIDEGYGYAEVARKLKRSVCSVQLQAKRQRCRLLHSQAVMTARQVADLLGLGCSKIVARWVQHCGLRARQSGPHRRGLWRIAWEDLTAWMARPETWMAWRPERIADLALREWAAEIRVDGPRWIAQTAVAARYQVSVKTVWSWIDKGWIVATKYGRGNWWVDARCLDTFVPPCCCSLLPRSYEIKLKAAA